MKAEKKNARKEHDISKEEEKVSGNGTRKVQLKEAEEAEKIAGGQGVERDASQYPKPSLYSESQSSTAVVH